MSAQLAKNLEGVFKASPSAPVLCLFVVALTRPIDQVRDGRLQGAISYSKSILKCILFISFYPKLTHCGVAPPNRNERRNSQRHLEAVARQPITDATE
jgi:hypothetical protein